MGAGELTTEGPWAWPALFPDHSIDPFLALAQSHSGGHIPTCSPPPPHPAPHTHTLVIPKCLTLALGSPCRWRNYSAKSDYANIVCSMTKLANSSGFIGGLRLKIPCPSPNPNIATKIWLYVISVPRQKPWSMSPSFLWMLPPCRGILYKLGPLSSS